MTNVIDFSIFVVNFEQGSSNAVLSLAMITLNIHMVARLLRILKSNLDSKQLTLNILEQCPWTLL